MENSNTGNQQRLDERETIVNKLIPSPQQRTSKVWKILEPYFKNQQIHSWDVICFCVSFLASQAVTLTWMKPAILKLSQLHYQAHYFATAELGLLENDRITKENNKSSEHTS